MAAPSGRAAIRCIASCTVAEGGSINYARLPQQVLDGDGRGTLEAGFGTDIFPRGRAALATDGFGSMWAGLVPIPNAMMDHRLSSIDPATAGAAPILDSYV